MFYNNKLPKFARLSTSITKRFQRGNNGGVMHSINPILLREFYRLLSAKPLTRIYADTCTLLHDSGMELLDAAEKVFSQTPGQHLLILTSVLFELKNVAKKNPAKYTRCMMVLDRLRKLSKSRIVKFVESSSPEFSDASFISLFVTESQEYDVILLTQDRSLASKCAHLASYLNGCVNSHSVRVFRLTTDGDLKPFTDEPISPKNRKENQYEENVYKSAFVRENKARKSAPRISERWSAPVYCSGGCYPKFHPKK